MFLFFLFIIDRNLELIVCVEKKFKKMFQCVLVVGIHTRRRNQ